MFSFAWPWLLLLAPLPWALRWLLPAARVKSAALQVSFLDELEVISQQGAAQDTGFNWRRTLVPILVWLLLLLSAARPETVGEPLPMESSGRDLLMAVDVSGSMQTPDMNWRGSSVTRLELIKQLMGRFIEKRAGDRVGLILFGSDAYLQSPLTFDRHTVRAWLNESLIGIAGGETAIGDAIGLGVKHLQKRPQNSRVLILITDGANNAGTVDPLKAAKLAADTSVRIYTIGIGADPRKGWGFGIFSQQAAADLDEDSLRKIASLTGGQYFRARSEQDLEAISNTLNKLEPVSQEATRSYRVIPLYHWPLSLAVLLVLLSMLHTLFPLRRARFRT